MKFPRAKLAALLLPFAFSNAHAESPPSLPTPPPQLAAFSQRPDEREHLLETMSRQWENLFDHRCKSLTATNWIVTENLEVSFDAQGKPTIGAWFDKAVLTGCGASHKMNVYSAIMDGKRYRLPALPGTTYADFILQHTATRSALEAARKYLPAYCKTSQTGIIETKFVRFEGDAYPGAEPGHGRPWREEWMVRQCDKLTVVTLHFVPDAKGTQFTADPDEARPLLAP